MDRPGSPQEEQDQADPELWVLCWLWAEIWLPWHPWHGHGCVCSGIGWDSSTPELCPGSGVPTEPCSLPGWGNLQPQPSPSLRIPVPCLASHEPPSKVCPCCPFSVSCSLPKAEVTGL